MKTYCPACGGADIHSFYRVERMTVHSVINIATPQEALAFPRGDLELAFCAECGFIFNRIFNASVMHYCSQCEETQGFSPTFSNWHHKLAQRVIDTYKLRDKSIIEIGCGKGEFLTMLCEMGGNRGVGFDPAYVPERNTSSTTSNIQFIQDLYSEKYSSYQADLVCCKMTLEHIDEPLAFLRTIRRAIGTQTSARLFFQVPDIRRVLSETAFWDVYYEHCSYFSLGSLARTFRLAGFDVLDLTSDYDGQYIMISAKPSDDCVTPTLAAEDDLAAVTREVISFERQARERIAEWRREFENISAAGRRVVLWGSGSKAVSFLSTIGMSEAIEYVVDINPYRQGTFMAGNGQKVVSPDYLTEYRPDTVLVMNEIYLDEVSRDLARLGLAPELKAVCGEIAAIA
jgi:SAM-dependent methyltransferase